MADIAERLHALMLRPGFQAREDQETLLDGKQEIERLRAALRPFAKFADPRRKVPPMMEITNGSAFAKEQLTMGQCYAAADALRQSSVTPPACR